MKLVRFGDTGKERPGLLTHGGKRVNLSQHFNDWDAEFFRRGGLDELTALLAKKDVGSFPPIDEDIRHGAPVARPGKVICVGLNYSDHAAESGMEIPKEPILFMKAANTVVGPYDNLIIPRGSKKTDWEVELGIVLGQDARY